LGASRGLVGFLDEASPLRERFTQNMLSPSSGERVCGWSVSVHGVSLTWIKIQAPTLSIMKIHGEALMKQHLQGNEPAAPIHWRRVALAILVSVSLWAFIVIAVSRVV
jgi:hypothetical protein